jgi:hypothetical protein
VKILEASEDSGEQCWRTLEIEAVVEKTWPALSADSQKVSIVGIVDCAPLSCAQ